MPFSAELKNTVELKSLGITNDSWLVTSNLGEKLKT